jgi:hypothetical protein
MLSDLGRARDKAAEDCDDRAEKTAESHHELPEAGVCPIPPISILESSRYF